MLSGLSKHKWDILLYCILYCIGIFVNESCEYCKIKIVFCSTRHATRVSQYHAVWSWCSMSLFTSIRQHTNYRSIIWYPYQEGILQLSIRCRTSKFQFFQFFSKRFFPLLFPTSLQYLLPTARYMFMYLPSPVTGSTRILPAPTNSNLGRQNTQRDATQPTIHHHSSFLHIIALVF